MGQKTALGSLLKAIGNSGQGKVVPGWGAVPVMTVIGLLLLVFLVILLQIYNQSLLLQGFSVDWNGYKVSETISISNLFRHNISKNTYWDFVLIYIVIFYLYIYNSQ